MKLSTYTYFFQNYPKQTTWYWNVLSLFFLIFFNYYSEADWASDSKDLGWVRTLLWYESPWRPGLWVKYFPPGCPLIAEFFAGILTEWGAPLQSRKKNSKNLVITLCRHLGQITMTILLGARKEALMKRAASVTFFTSSRFRVEQLAALGLFYLCVRIFFSEIWHLLAWWEDHSNPTWKNTIYRKFNAGNNKNNNKLWLSSWCENPRLECIENSGLQSFFSEDAKIHVLSSICDSSMWNRNNYL